MVSMRFLASVALLLASQQLAAQAAPQLCTVAASVLQECKPLLDPASASAYCCSPFSAMLDLDCFCSPETNNVFSSVLSASVLQAIGSKCGVNALDMVSEYCVSKERAEPATDANMLTGSVEGVDTRPVLDLSQVDDNVASLVLQREAGEDQGVTVTYQETTDGQGETTYSVGVEMPDDMDLDLELEFEEPAGNSDSEVTVTVDGLSQLAGAEEGITVELTTDDSGRVYSATFVPDGVMIDELVISMSDAEELVAESWLPEAMNQALDQATGVSGALLAAMEDEASAEDPDLDFEVNLALPEGLMGQFDGKDVSIEMEYNLAEGASFNSAEITVEDGVPESSFNGQAIGNLLKEAAQYMAAELSIPMHPSEDQDLPELTRKETLLGGALQFLAEIGEDISVSIPDRQLHDGDFIEIERQTEVASVRTVEGSSNELGLLPSPVNRRSLDRLSEAIEAARLEEPMPEGAWTAACTICEAVDRYLYVLWGFVAAGVAILAYYVVVAVLRRASHAPTDPNEELKQPLIVVAADYTPEGSKDALLLPIWSPAKTLQ